MVTVIAGDDDGGCSDGVRGSRVESEKASVMFKDGRKNERNADSALSKERERERVKHARHYCII